MTSVPTEHQPTSSADKFAPDVGTATRAESPSTDSDSDENQFASETQETAGDGVDTPAKKDSVEHPDPIETIGLTITKVRNLLQEEDLLPAELDSETEDDIHKNFGIAFKSATEEASAHESKGLEFLHDICRRITGTQKRAKAMAKVLLANQVKMRVDDKTVVMNYIGEGTFGDAFRLLDYSDWSTKVMKLSKNPPKTSIDPEKNRKSEEEHASADRFDRDVHNAEVMSASGAHVSPTVFKKGIHQIKVKGTDNDGNPTVIKQDRSYYTMEYMDGAPLDEISNANMEKQRLIPPSRVQAMLMLILRTLHYCHENNIVHRDVKPGNLMLNKNGKLQIYDFGLAIKEGSTHMTQTGVMIGSPSFAAPEQLSNARDAGPSADLYGAGASAYYMLTGEPPVPGNNFATIIMNYDAKDEQSEAPLYPIMEPIEQVSPELAKVIRQLLIRKPPVDRGEIIDHIERLLSTSIFADRFETAQQFIDEQSDNEKLLLPMPEDPTTEEGECDPNAIAEHFAASCADEKMIDKSSIARITEAKTSSVMRQEHLVDSKGPIVSGKFLTRAALIALVIGGGLTALHYGTRSKPKPNGTDVQSGNLDPVPSVDPKPLPELPFSFNYTGSKDIPSDINGMTININNQDVHIPPEHIGQYKDGDRLLGFVMPNLFEADVPEGTDPLTPSKLPPAYGLCGRHGFTFLILNNRVILFNPREGIVWENNHRYEDGQFIPSWKEGFMGTEGFRFKVDGSPILPDKISPMLNEADINPIEALRAFSKIREEITKRNEEELRPGAK